MQIDVNFHPDARQEYLDATAWYLTHSKTIARAFQQEVQMAVDCIQDGPSQWPIFEPQIHWVRLKRFPYLLYFEIRDLTCGVRTTNVTQGQLKKYHGGIHRCPWQELHP